MIIQRKYSPYIFIFILCIIIGCLRLWILTGFAWYIHIIAFLGQFIVMSAIWQLIGFINKKLERRFTIEQQPGMQMLLQVAVTVLLLSPVFFVTYLLVKDNLPEFVTNRVLILLVAIFFMALMLLTFGYYTYNLFVKYKASTEERTRLELQAAHLEKEKSMMRYLHLKNQVNPHFLFNTLTSLDGLIQSNPDLASEFVRHLSKVYRYVLEHKENEVVSIETETNFIQHYISLLQIRYKDAIEIKLNLSGTAMEKGIVMVTLQMLIDNAIKHNIVQNNMPLKIVMWDEGECLHIRNNKQLRKQIETSTKHGLKQLKEMYFFLTDKPVHVKDSAESFEINLPLL
jgi:two-component system, LytTR family, sensor kinase